MNTATETITNTQDIIDSRDVIARIDELESELTDVKDGESVQAEALNLGKWIDGLNIDQHPFEDAIIEYKSLKALADEASGYASDWSFGEMLIADSHFEDYAQELAEDLGCINEATSWPNNCIDWERAARELQMDYTSVDFDGETYWIR